MDDESENDPPLSAEQNVRIDRLSDVELREIAEAILRSTEIRWRKVARVIGSAMISLEGRYEGVPDVFYAQRIKALVESGLLESKGNLNRMRHSEVKRLKFKNDKTS